MTEDNVLCTNRYFLWVKKKFQPTPTKQDLGTSEGFFSNFPRAAPSFLYGTSPGNQYHHDIVFICFCPGKALF